MALPFDKRSGVIWLDGKLVEWEKANLHVLTHSLHYAGSVFEGARAYGGEIFKLREHSERLKKSANILDYEIPYSVEEIDEACNRVVREQGLKDAYIRPLAWRGSEMMGVAGIGNTIHLAVAAWEWPSYFDPAQKLKGLRLDLAQWRRPDPRTAPFRAKASGLYMIATLAKQAADAKGYDDALMLDWRGQVAECTGANIFFVKEGALYTPAPDCFLDGITRRTVIDLARRRGITVHERAIMPEELEGFEQCFLTGTAAEVTPVSEIAAWKFEVGSMVQNLMQDYATEVRPKSGIA